MLFPLLLVLVPQFINGLQHQTYSRSLRDFRQFCPSQHFANKYKVSCDGSNKIFKDKNLVLDSRSANGITDIELYSFESISFNQSASDWSKINVTIKNCSKVMFGFESTLKFQKLYIDSVDNLTLQTTKSEYNVDSGSILLSNIGELNLKYADKVSIKADLLTLINVQDVNFHGKLQFLGRSLNISQSNIDVMKNSTVNLSFDSVAIRDSTKLLIQHDGQLVVSSDNVTIEESDIYLEGSLDFIGFNNSGGEKVIRFLKNSIYKMKTNLINFYGNKNEINFINNGIYVSDIGEVITMIEKIKGVTFSRNRFGCDMCTNNRQLLQSKYLEDIGEDNFCDLTCNLTLIGYKSLVNQEKICHQDVFEMDEALCLAANSSSVGISEDSWHSWWIFFSLLVVSLGCVSSVFYFFCNRNSFRFQPIQTGNISESQEIQKAQNQEAAAFNSGVYDLSENQSVSIYEVVD